MKCLIIANARYKGGLSGSDAIYTALRLELQNCDVWEMMDIDFKPFTLCYLVRIFLSIMKALFCFKHYDFVYSASDFIMDSIPAFIIRMKDICRIGGTNWIAGFFLLAPKNKKLYYYSQKIILHLIRGSADGVVVTNKSMYYLFPDNNKTWINGGIDMSKTIIHVLERKKYDAVFCGRMHNSKGIHELVEIWEKISISKPDAKLAVIGDGDLGKQYFKTLIRPEFLNNFELFGYMNDERFEIYKQSRVVLYPAIYDHFSIAPVEAMACGCPMVAFRLNVMKHFNTNAIILASNVDDFVKKTFYVMKKYRRYKDSAIEFASHFSWQEQLKRVVYFIKTFGGSHENISNRLGWNGRMGCKEIVPKGTIDTYG